MESVWGAEDVFDVVSVILEIEITKKIMKIKKINLYFLYKNSMFLQLFSNLIYRFMLQNSKIQENKIK